MPDSSAETYRVRSASDPSRIVVIPALIVVQPASGTARLVAFRGDVTVMPSAPPADSVEQRFHQLKSEWLRDTGILSNPVEILMHPAHVKLLGMGPKILPLVLREVEKMSGHWFMILYAISPENPVTPEDQTNIQRTAHAWLEWGKKQGLL